MDEGGALGGRPDSRPRMTGGKSRVATDRRERRAASTWRPATKSGPRRSPRTARAQCCCLAGPGERASLPDAEDGTTFVLDAGTGELLATNPLPQEEKTVATPVLVNGNVLLRTFEHLYCFGGEAAPAG